MQINCAVEVTFCEVLFTPLLTVIVRIAGEDSVIVGYHIQGISLITSI